MTFRQSPKKRPPALMAEAELYEEMGRLYDQKYYDTAVKTYLSMMDQYSSSQYRSAAVFAIGEIQKDDQNKSLEAQATFRDFLKRFPRSDHADDARKALKEIAANLSGKQTASSASDQFAPSSGDAASNSQSGPSQPQPAIASVTDDPSIAGVVIQPREDDNRLSTIKDLQTTNSRDAARVIIALDDTVDYQSARIASPDRIYFNLSRAVITLKAARAQFDSQNGLIRSLRIAQNKPDVTRIVLDAPDAKDYNAYLLSKPYRLVIEISTKLGAIPTRQVGMVISPSTGLHALADSTKTAMADAGPTQPRERPVSLSALPHSAVPGHSIRT